MSEKAINYNKLLTKEEFESRLRKIGATRYHNLHPFHKLLHGGKLNKGQVQAWALNRYYYQCNIPIKDCALMSRMKDPELRRIWRKRVFDHDGRDVRSGPIRHPERYVPGKVIREGVENTLSSVLHIKIGKFVVKIPLVGQRISVRIDAARPIKEDGVSLIE